MRFIKIIEIASRKLNLESLVKIISFIFAAAFLFTTISQANEGGEEQKEEKGESPGEATKKGGEGAGKSEFVEYSRRLNRMTQLQSKVNDDTRELKELIEQKNHGVTEVKDEKTGQQSILAIIVEKHKSLTADTGLFNDELRAITYRFPSKGEEISRKYIPLRPKTLDQVEQELGLDGDLTALKDKVDTKYQAFAPPEEPAAPSKPKRPEATLKDKAAEKPPRLKLSK